MQLDTFTQAYLECALYTSTDNSTPSGGYPLDKNYNLMDFTEEAMAKAEAECAAFQSENEGLLEFAGTDKQNGCDFWLTRNQHGAGFWCRDYDNDTAMALTDAAHAHGECHVYIGDDGKLHLNG
jgi:hypothetical protein